MTCDMACAPHEKRARAVRRRAARRGGMWKEKEKNERMGGASRKLKTGDGTARPSLRK